MNHELVVSYEESKGYRIVSAPPMVSFSAEFLERVDPERIKVEGDLITIYEQVVYRRAGTDYHGTTAFADLVEDRRIDKVNGDWWTPPGWKRPEEKMQDRRYDSEPLPPLPNSAEVTVTASLDKDWRVRARERVGAKVEERMEKILAEEAAEEPNLAPEQLDLDELFDDWIKLWEFWGPSEHLFRSVNIIEIAYAVAELDEDVFLYGRMQFVAREQVLRKIIKDKLIRQYRRPEDDQTRAAACGLADRLLGYCQDHPRSLA